MFGKEKSSQLQKAKEEAKIAKSKMAATKANLKAERQKAQAAKVKETGFSHGVGFWDVKKTGKSKVRSCRRK